MNIKHVFIAATAALVLPGLAMAQTSFPTSIAFTNGNDGTVNVALTCNSGNPLVQDFDISAADGVTFVVNGIVADSTCTIALSGVDEGYTTAPVSCVFTGENLVIDGSNACDFTATPVANVWSPSKEWVNVGPDVSQVASFTWFCINASDTTDGSAEGFGGDLTRTGDFEVDVDVYPAPGETAYCTLTENVEGLDSAVESDQGCSGDNGNLFTIGSGDDGCTITNTAFYEGIPTLSQYGMAIMVLLMLGVGFVGFRRFV
jgi:hypothetical protein